MDAKKKTFLENLRLKTKLVNLKKPRKKATGMQGRRLAHRRSISVPDLRFVPGEAFSTENALVSTASDAIFFGNSSGVSDTDSIASGSVTDGPLFTDKLNNSVPEIRPKVPTDRTAAALNRVSAPVETLTLEEYEDMINSGSEKELNLTREALYAQVNKRAKGNVPRFTFDPIPAPRSVFANALSPRPDLVERESLSGEDNPADRVLSDVVAGALARAHSIGNEVNSYTEKRTTSYEQRKPSSGKGTPPAIRQNAPGDRVSLRLDIPSTPLESADGTSLDSACGTPSEEQVSMPWTTDSEELDPEACSPFLVKEFSTEEALLEEAQFEEASEEKAEVSFIQVYLTVRTVRGSYYYLKSGITVDYVILNLYSDVKLVISFNGNKLNR